MTMPEPAKEEYTYKQMIIDWLFIITCVGGFLAYCLWMN